ncbi:MAG TPA: CHRD domain-containing protein [Flavitalea sp.]|nr:CHRD domain-containing protein [Flavitalea sp.]
MRLLKPFSMLTLVITLLAACKEDLPTIISRRNLPMSGANEIPAKTGSGNGSINIDYNQSTRILTYTVTWNSLSGPVTGMHIHGSADKFTNAPILQNFSGYPTTQSGTYTGTVLVDGVVIKEEDLFRGGFYINIHTALNPGGEIRGQIEF